MSRHFKVSVGRLIKNKKKKIASSLFSVSCQSEAEQMHLRFKRLDHHTSLSLGRQETAGGMGCSVFTVTYKTLEALEFEVCIRKKDGTKAFVVLQKVYFAPDKYLVTYMGNVTETLYGQLFWKKTS